MLQAFYGDSLTLQNKKQMKVLLHKTKFFKKEVVMIKQEAP